MKKTLTESLTSQRERERERERRTAHLPALLGPATQKNPP
jgi:hypothetical protein